jgi:hypothetical protein
VVSWANRLAAGRAVGVQEISCNKPVLKNRVSQEMQEVIARSRATEMARSVNPLQSRPRVRLLQQRSDLRAGSRIDLP